uniref:Uncharacterized protein n=1 Tax=Avena sativa TaxID=4498 RepID=A0ACD5UV63_AVESA
MVFSIAVRAPPTLMAPRRPITSILSAVRPRGGDLSRSTQASLAKMPVTAKTMSGYEPSAWGNFFIEYEPQPPQDWMRQRVDKLKQDVCMLFSEARNNVTGTLLLVDAVQILGIDHLFKEQIDMALRYVHQHHFNSACLYEVALRFRLLREHGLWVSSDVFDKFMDARHEEITMYNATFLSVHGEPRLEEAMSFARYHLESIKGNLKSPLAEQVKRALHIPLPRTYERLETLHYFSEYEQEEGYNPILLELAKLEFTLLQYVHSKELKSMSRWWKDAYGYIGLSYARDRLVEAYTWSYILYYEKDFEMARMMVTKITALLTVMNDTYDAHATIEESRQLNTAIQRWDHNAESLLPDYLKMFYKLLLTTFQEFEDQLGLNHRNQVVYVKKEFQRLSSYYLQEAEWTHQNYKPSFETQLSVTAKSIGVPLLCVASVVGMGDAVMKGTMEWVLDGPIVISCGKIVRLMNDMGATDLGRNKGDVATTVECYMHEHEVNSEVALAWIDSFMQDEWKTINQARLEDAGPALYFFGPWAKSINGPLKTIYICTYN